jgi:hypothetical protein
VSGQPPSGFGDPRWHLLYDLISRAYVNLAPDDQVDGLALSINAESGLPGAITVSPTKTGARRVVFPDRHGHPVRVPDTAEAAGGAL